MGNRKISLFVWLYARPVAGLAGVLVLASSLRADDPTRQRTSTSQKQVTGEPVISADRNQKDRDAAKAIDRMRADLEEWGTVNVSEPLIYPVHNQFSLGDPADFSKTSAYIANEQSQINAAVSQLAQMALAASFNGSLNLPQLTAPTAAAPTGTSPASGTPASTAPVLGVPAQATPADAPQSQAKNFLAKQTFESLGGLLGPGVPNAIPQRQAIILGAGDKITELLARMMANPPKAEGTNLYLAIFQVTCNPGWRTLQNYQADVFVGWEYAFSASDGTLCLSLSDRNNLVAPRVVAILPLLDAQNMELRNGQRELYSVLISLAASGALSSGNAAGKGVLDYINSYQKDSASRNAMPVVNSYTTGTGMGFRFAPSFVAIADPAKKKSPAANRLIPTSFPVLAVVAMRPTDVDPKNSNIDQVKKSHAGYDQLLTYVSYRWLIRDRRVSLWPWDWELPKRRENEVLRLNRSIQAQYTFDKLVSQKNSLPSEIQKTREARDQQLLRTDYLELMQKTVTKYELRALPEGFHDAPPPTVTSIMPSSIDPTMSTTFIVQGTEFTDDVEIYLGGMKCQETSIPSIDSSMVPAGASKRVRLAVFDPGNPTESETAMAIKAADDLATAAAEKADARGKLATAKQDLEDAKQAYEAAAKKAKSTADKADEDSRLLDSATKTADEAAAAASDAAKTKASNADQAQQKAKDAAGKKDKAQQDATTSKNASDAATKAMNEANDKVVEKRMVVNRTAGDSDVAVAKWAGAQARSNFATKAISPNRISTYQSTVGLVADVVVKTASGAASFPVKVDLTRQQKQDDRDLITVTRDAQGNVNSIDLSRFDGVATKDLLDALTKIIVPASAAAASKQSSTDPANTGAGTGKPSSTPTPAPSPVTVNVNNSNAPVATPPVGPRNQ